MKRIARVAWAALALLSAACNDAPVAPQPHAQYDEALNADIGKLARYRNGSPSLQENYVKKTIGPAGGSLSLGGFEVIVPPDAVSRPTSFSIRLPLDPVYVWASFGPHGMQFNSAVTLRLPFQGTTSDVTPSGHAMWFDGLLWVELPSTMTPDGRVQTETTHFSDYGTEETERGITTAGN